jgi:hypothetical protein
MSGEVIFPINYNTSKVDTICDNPGSVAKEFGRSLIHNMAMVFGMGHAADYKFGKGDIDRRMENMQKDMEMKKWEITTNLFTKQIKTEGEMIKVMNQILINLQQQSDYYKSIYEPQFETINLLDNFRIMLLFTIIFVLITFINWK